MLTVEQLLTPLTEAEVKAKLYEMAEDLGLPTTSWLSGAPMRTLIAILAMFYGAFMAPLIVLITKSGFLDDAEEGWLTLVARMVYGVERREATFATGEVTLTNAGGGIFAFDIGEAVFKNSTTNATYVNTEAIALGASGTQTVDIRASEPGSGGNATAGQVDSIVTTMQSVSVTNAAVLTGVDEESDPDLRQRCRDRLGALSPDGPAAAYRFVALTPELNGGANINRVKVLPAPGNGTATVLLASPSGVPSGSDVTLVQTAFDTWATPDTSLSIATGATEFAHSLNATVYVNTAAGLTNSEWQALIKTALVDWVNTLPIEGLELTPGSRLIPYRSVIGVIERVRPTGSEIFYVLHASLASQVDVTVTSGSVVTLDPADITLTINQVSQAS